MFYSSRRPSKDLAKVTSSAYSKSPPTGSPWAILVVRMPEGFTSREIYIAVASPSMFGFVARITSSIESSRSEEHTSELQSRGHLVCRLLLEKKKNRPTH